MGHPRDLAPRRQPVSAASAPARASRGRAARRPARSCGRDQHTFFDRISLRGPQFLQGWLHFYNNNYQFQWYEYGAGGMRGPQFLSEPNVYEARPGNFCFVRSRCADPNPCGDFDARVSKLALCNDWDSNGPGYTRSVGDLAVEGADVQEHEPARVSFDPASRYAYALDPADATLTQRLRVGAGPRVRYCR